MGAVLIKCAETEPSDKADGCYQWVKVRASFSNVY